MGHGAGMRQVWLKHAKEEVLVVQSDVLAGDFSHVLLMG